MSKIAIEVKNLRKDFGKLVAIDQISFSIMESEIVGFLGANGAGKTTLIYLLLGLLTPSSGIIRIFGFCPISARNEILSFSNFASGYISLPSNLTVRENLLVFARLYRVKEPELKIDFLLDLLEITHLQHKVTGFLSAGELTRVCLCKALLNDPKLLFLDEPTAGLDPSIADKVCELLLELRKKSGVTIIYTSHNMRDVERLCDRIIFMKSGKIITQGIPLEIVQEFKQRNLEELFIELTRK
ncbi:ABC transporter ATP-binding protein [Candidatus Methylacidiphilum fumarolicum]|uniref:ABC-type multidrug transport system, ATPase component n=2 Tax=Candidatus Methylacidiphilum fumarolicum TaxID=591154 RepID=I0JW64_METFB|nr:ABC transporter ATP-binding protein [Candidatus Methylacidiphilum fumarolicum]MBW6415753.1 ABC transporter ATP-binding protein [Candidatus Methylacidiphilum fumarolicum]TFE65851.1 ABC transporter ATP-binding protein [Candidatus Methylacidiphilum fumarolicum]TFE71827.1 ABC transporter ATP-binding protein [Candidatus Methylacidiphilum fumarolicum]TFE72033.1 ABC transporter ATP-binding protein [Candidatus Methylacidiphilum fumarolicum]TFE76459.1 ABC transporter ATP-binding protein [Candidatus 